MSFFIRKDTKRDYVKADKVFILPVIPGPDLPKNEISGVGGGLLYNNQNKLPYYNDGTQWLPFGSGGGGSSTIKTYSIKVSNSGDPVPIPDSAYTIIEPWTSTPSPPWHDDTSSWNLLTGIYTAGSSQSLMIAANITWTPGPSSTIGIRRLQIIYKPLVGIPDVAKEAVTQPDPDQNIATTQEASIILKLTTGDQAWVQVFQDSGVGQSISEGTESTITGFQCITS